MNTNENFEKEVVTPGKALTVTSWFFKYNNHIINIKKVKKFFFVPSKKNCIKL